MDSKKSIYKAIAEFQQEVPVLVKDTQGFGYSYTDLPAILKVINPLMKKHGMGFSQTVNRVSDTDGKYHNVLDTVVFHLESGEAVESSIIIPSGVTLAKMNDFQVMGSAITYLRRYALSAILGLVTDKDTDAGGEQTKPATSGKKELDDINLD